jgi:hypothetical protein
MLASAVIISILYIQVALVLFGILTIDGGVWRFHAPTGKKGIRDFFGQFSWGRLNRPSGAAGDQSIDASTGVSDGSLDRGRKNAPKSFGKKSTTTTTSVFGNAASSRPARLKKLAIKMLWYPSGMCHISLRESRSDEPFAVYLVLILPVTLCRIDPSLNVDLNVLLGFTCMLLFMVRHNSPWFSEYT